MTDQLAHDASPHHDWVPTDTYDWMRTERNILVLNYTLACPLRCDFCCYACHSGRTAQTMPKDRALALVRQAADLGEFSSIGFTGGEPLLFVDEVCEIGDAANRLGMPFTVATAGHWAETPSAADDVVGRLAVAGLIRLNISHDPSHATFVDSQNIMNALHAAVRHDIPTYVVGTFTDADQRLDHLLPDARGLPGVKFFNKYVAAVGRAANRHITQDTYGLDLKLKDLRCYRREYHDLVVFYDGRAYPCCSTFNRSTPGLSVGNAFTEPLRTIWERTEGSLLLRTMKRQGFDEVYRIVGETDPDLLRRLPDAKDAAGPCSLCHRIFADRELSRRVTTAFDRHEEAQVEKALRQVQAWVGESVTSSFMNDVLSASDTRIPFGVARREPVPLSPSSDRSRATGGGESHGQ